MTAPRLCICSLVCDSSIPLLSAWVQFYRPKVDAIYVVTHRASHTLSWMLRALGHEMPLIVTGNIDEPMTPEIQSQWTNYLLGMVKDDAFDWAAPYDDDEFCIGDLRKAVERPEECTCCYHGRGYSYYCLSEHEARDPASRMMWRDPDNEKYAYKKPLVRLASDYGKMLTGNHASEVSRSWDCMELTMHHFTYRPKMLFTHLERNETIISLHHAIRLGLVQDKTIRYALAEGEQI